MMQFMNEDTHFPRCKAGRVTPDKFEKGNTWQAGRMERKEGVKVKTITRGVGRGRGWRGGGCAGRAAGERASARLPGSVRLSVH